jgi:tetratricopeptide (TPR) repeat protein
VESRLRTAELERAAADARAVEAAAKAAAERRALRMTVGLAAAALLLLGVVGFGAWRWWQGHEARLAEEAEAARAVDADLQRAEALRQEGRWGEALALVELARQRLPHGDEERRRRAEQARADVQLLRRLEQVRLDEAEVAADGNFGTAQAGPAYADAFRAYGLDLEKLEPAAAAERLRASGLGEPLTAALDDWAGLLTADAAQRERLLTAARLADPDPTRSRLRQAAAGGNARELADLAAKADAAALPPATVSFTARELYRAGLSAEAIALLRAGQVRHPGDFWLNLQLALYCYFAQPRQADEAARCAAAAVAARPDNALAHVALGLALEALGQADRAEAVYREAVRLKPDQANAHGNLANVLFRRGKSDEAVGEYREAIRLKATARTRLNLGTALQEMGQPKQAEAEFREALKLEPGSVEGRLGLGDALKAQGRAADAESAYGEAIRQDKQLSRVAEHLGGDRDPIKLLGFFRGPVRGNEAQVLERLARLLESRGRWLEAAAAYREMLRFNPADPRATQARLGQALLRQGRFREAADASAAVRPEAERLARLDADTSPFAFVPQGATAWDDRGDLMYHKQAYAGAAACFGMAFALGPARTARRYEAACAAALAGCGRGADAGRLPEAEKARLRGQALAWLRAERAGAPERAGQWLDDPDLDGVRDPDALAKLPEAERKEWAAFWDDVRRP